MKTFSQILVIVMVGTQASFAQQIPDANQQLEIFRMETGLGNQFELPRASSVVPKNYTPVVIGDRLNNFACVGEAFSNLVSLQMTNETRRNVTVTTNDVTLTTSAILNLIEKGTLPYAKGDISKENLRVIENEKSRLRTQFSRGDYIGADPYFSALLYNALEIEIPVSWHSSISKVSLSSYAQFPSMEANSGCYMQAVYEVVKDGVVKDGSDFECEEFLNVMRENVWSVRLKNPGRIVMTLKQLLAEKKSSILALLKTDKYMSDPDTAILSDFQKGSIGHAINIVDYDENYFYVFDSWSDKKLHRYRGANRIYKIKPAVLMGVLTGFEVATGLDYEEELSEADSKNNLVAIRWYNGIEQAYFVDSPFIEKLRAEKKDPKAPNSELKYPNDVSWILNNLNSIQSTFAEEVAKVERTTGCDVTLDVEIANYKKFIEEKKEDGTKEEKLVSDHFGTEITYGATLKIKGWNHETGGVFAQKPIIYTGRRSPDSRENFIDSQLIKAGLGEFSKQELHCDPPAISENIDYNKDASNSEDEIDSPEEGQKFNDASSYQKDVGSKQTGHRRTDNLKTDHRRVTGSRKTSRRIVRIVRKDNDPDFNFLNGKLSVKRIVWPTQEQMDAMFRSENKRLKNR